MTIPKANIGKMDRPVRTTLFEDHVLREIFSEKLFFATSFVAISFSHLSKTFCKRRN